MNNLVKKLGEIQRDLKAPKAQYNKFGNYSFRNCEDILEAVKPLLVEHECVLTISDELTLIGDRYYVKATAKLHNNGHTIETNAYARESLSKKGMDDSQITGASSSYARKYALNGLFCIDDTKDADNRDNTESVKVNTANNVSEAKSMIGKIFKKDVKEKYVMNFGKYKGKSIEQIGVDACIGYADYILRAAKEQNKPITSNDVKEFLNVIDDIKLEKGA